MWFDTNNARAETSQEGSLLGPLLGFCLEQVHPHELHEAGHTAGAVGVKTDERPGMMYRVNIGAYRRYFQPPLLKRQSSALSREGV